MNRIYILLCFLTINIYATTTMKLGILYLNNTTPKTISIDNGKETILENNTIAPAVLGEFEIAREFSSFVDSFGVVGEIGANINLGYGIMTNKLTKRQAQNYIPGYIGTYLQFTIAYKFKNEMRLRVGARGGIGANVTFLLKEEYLNSNEENNRNIYIPGYAVPFGGVVGFDYKNLIVDFNLGVNYLFAESAKKVDKIVNVISFGGLDFNLPNNKLNELSYDKVQENGREYNKNKFAVTFGLKVGVRF